MQRLGKTLIDCLRTAAALRVGTPSSPASLPELATAAAGRPHLARLASTAGASTSTSGSAPAAAALQTSPLTLHQARKRELRPEVSGRNAFRRAWAKRLQIKVSDSSRPTSCQGCFCRIKCNKWQRPLPMRVPCVPYSITRQVPLLTVPFLLLLGRTSICSGMRRSARPTSRLRDSGGTSSGCSSSSSVPSGLLSGSSSSRRRPDRPVLRCVVGSLHALRPLH